MILEDHLKLELFSNGTIHVFIMRILNKLMTENLLLLCNQINLNFWWSQCRRFYKVQV